MSVTREGHTASTLTNGEVLVVGGMDTKSLSLHTAELYDPSTRNWSATGTLHIARWSHTASVLKDGRVLVTGGDDNTNEERTTSELYDPSTGDWILTGNMHDARLLHTASVLLDGKVLVTGGLNKDYKTLNTCELYDPSTGNWTQINPMHYVRFSHTASLLLDGKLLVTGGGIQDIDDTLKTCEIYDPSTGHWTKIHDMHHARMSHTATVLTDGTVLVTGGINNSSVPIYTKSVELYNPSTGNWTLTDPMKEKRCSHTASLLLNEKVLVIGGYNFHEYPDSLNSTELYDPLTRKWEYQSPLQMIRSYHTTSVLKNGNILVAGGSTCDFLGHTLNSCELYNSTTKTF